MPRTGIEHRHGPNINGWIAEWTTARAGDSGGSGIGNIEQTPVEGTGSWRRWPIHKKKRFLDRRLGDHN